MSDDASTPARPTPGDTSYIRTYAKDLAAHGGTSADATNVSPAPPPPPAPTPAPQPVAPVTAPPPEPPPAQIIPNAPSTNESRESVLARLRAKTSSQTAPPAPAPDTARQSILDRLNAKAGVPTPQPPKPVTPVAPTPASQPTGPDPLHTYKSDFAEKTKEAKASPLSVLAAEQDAKGTPAPVALKPSPGISPMVLGGIALIVLGGASVFMAFQYMNGRSVLPTQLFVPSIIFADEQTRIEGSGMELQRELLGLREQPLDDGEVVLAYLTYATTTSEGTTEVAATGADLFSALDLAVPEIVMRNMTNEAAVGVVRAAGETRPFFILRVSSYERTFAGMLAWEKNMVSDLGYLFPLPEVPTAEPTFTTATTTATSTPVVASSTPAKTTFVMRFRDAVVENHDVRILKDADGQTIILYGYRDKETLIIARNEAAFTELLGRLTSARSQ